MTPNDNTQIGHQVFSETQKLKVQKLPKKCGSKERRQTQPQSMGWRRW